MGAAEMVEGMAVSGTETAAEMDRAAAEEAGMAPATAPEQALRTAPAMEGKAAPASIPE